MDNETRHTVTLTQGFFLQTTEVTQAQWQKVMGSNPSYLAGDSLPVERVSWDDTQVFIQKLNSKGDGTYRLPTEAEWEYAARAGGQTTFTCGDTESCLDEIAWYGVKSGHKTHPVGQKQPNAWGLYDMAGNVFEWIQDGYGPYPDTGVTDPSPATAKTDRIFRGGSWNAGVQSCRSAARYHVAAHGISYDVGFRLIREEQ